MELLIADDLFSNVLMSALDDAIVDGLQIVSGYATPSMVGYHMAQVARSYGGRDLSVDLTVGMTASDGLRLDYHRGFQKLSAESTAGPGTFAFSCGYTMASGPAVHSKVYVWSRRAEPFLAFVGSANYTQMGMGVARAAERKEVMTRVDALAASDYVRAVAAGRIDVNDEDVQSELVLYREPSARPAVLGPEQDDDSALVLPRVPHFDVSVSLSLLSSHTGRVHNSGGGLNHGQRDGRSNKNEAYIPVPSSIQRDAFFPPPGEHFLVSTDDGKVLIMSTGSGAMGKDLRTPLRNGDLGEYLRYRMGIPNGAPFTDDDFAQYGRADVDFYRIDEETYFLDFSRP